MENKNVSNSHTTVLTEKKTELNIDTTMGTDKKTTYRENTTARREPTLKAAFSSRRQIASRRAISKCNHVILFLGIRTTRNQGDFV